MEIDALQMQVAPWESDSTTFRVEYIIYSTDDVAREQLDQPMEAKDDQEPSRRVRPGSCSGRGKR
jgi:hypothetical protein